VVNILIQFSSLPMLSSESSMKTYEEQEVLNHALLAP